MHCDVRLPERYVTGDMTWMDNSACTDYLVPSNSFIQCRNLWRWREATPLSWRQLGAAVRSLKLNWWTSIQQHCSLGLSSLGDQDHINPMVSFMPQVWLSFHITQPRTPSKLGWLFKFYPLSLMSICTCFSTLFVHIISSNVHKCLSTSPQLCSITRRLNSGNYFTLTTNC